MSHATSHVLGNERHDRMQRTRRSLSVGGKVLRGTSGVARTASRAQRATTRTPVTARSGSLSKGLAPPRVRPCDLASERARPPPPPATPAIVPAATRLVPRSVRAVGATLVGRDTLDRAHRDAAPAGFGPATGRAGIGSGRARRLVAAIRRLSYSMRSSSTSRSSSWRASSGPPTSRSVGPCRRACIP